MGWLHIYFVQEVALIIWSKTFSSMEGLPGLLGPSAAAAPAAGRPSWLWALDSEGSVGEVPGLLAVRLQVNHYLFWREWSCRLDQSFEG